MTTKTFFSQLFCIIFAKPKKIKFPGEILKMFRKILFGTEIYFAVWFLFGEQKNDRSPQ